VHPAHNPRRQDGGPPCKRCAGTSWDIEEQAKSTPRWVMETVFAAPDVWIFQGESAGWPGRTYERWTCANCGRAARVAPQ
jgi:hypothetical protein